ncbi:surface anchored protein [Streptococcus pneumoniae]|uniref:Rib/alpha-like domain-containing protein n=1 Tax=Streptococcus pneumoniae TaxID=1313 RepID=UPI0005DAC847|nr:Rib/alpha-like domain-containing protein [Streptococcus pneumoniae]CIS59516.1 surface anchored protein [Streptococcus pneumoniae]CRE49255.1 surface anchored protein [Streptococcus pneumoniae]
MRKSYRDDNGEKIFRYSIRKYHFGAASVAVAALMFFANGTVQAQTPEISPATESGTTKTSALVSDSSGGSKEISEESPDTAPSEPEQSSQGNQKLQEASDENKSLAKTSEEGKGEKQAEILQPRTLKTNQSDYDPIPLGDDEDDVRDGLFSSENPVTTIQPRSSHSVTSRAVQSDTIAPKVMLGNTILPTSESAATTPIYKVVQGSAFTPKLKIWDNSGFIKNLDITGIPNGVTKQKFGNDFVEQTTAREDTPYSGSTFSGNVADTQVVGQHTAQITVKGASDNVATYYLKYEVYPARVEAKQSRFGQVKDKALIHGDDPANYIKFKNANGQVVQKPADVEVTWERKPSTSEAGLNKTGVVKVTYHVTDENGAVRDEVQTVTINTPVYHATLIQNPFTTTYGREFVNKNQPRDGRRYISYNGRNHFNLSNLRVYWENSNIRGEKFSDGTRPWLTNYLGKKREQLMVRYPGDSGRYDSRNDDYGERHEILDGTFIVKPVKPSIQASLGKIGKDRVTVDNVNSGTTVVVYDAANPKNLIELGRTMVAKEGDYKIKNGVEVPLNSGVTLKKGQKIVTKVIYAIMDNDQRTDSDVSDTWTVKESLIANGIHVIKGESYTGAVKDRIRYNDSTDAERRTALPGNATASWAQNPNYTTLGTNNYTANVTIPGQGSATVKVPVHVYAPASLKATSYNNKQGTLSNGANPENYIEFKDGNTVVPKPNNVTVRWQGGVAPRINTPGHNRGVIEVVYPGNAGASSTVVKTFTVQLPTYHTTAKATEYTRTIGENFAKTTARDYATTHNWNVGGSQYVWKNDETANREYSAENWGKVNGDWLGKKKNKVKVYYGNDNGSNSHSENLAEETEEITFITKPKTPNVTATALNGKAGQRNQQVTVNNVTPGTRLYLYDGDTLVGQMDVPKESSETYASSKDVTMTLSNELPYSSNIRAKVVYMPDNNDQRVESEFSASAQSTTSAPQAPTIKQNPENLTLTSIVGQEGSNRATLTYTDANGRQKTVGFTKTGTNWNKDDANADSTISILNGDNGQGEIRIQAGTAQEGSTVAVNQQTATSAVSDNGQTKVLGRLEGLTNVAQADGSVDITVPDTATKFDLTYRNQQNNTTETLHYSKDSQGRWGNVTGITADGNRFTLPKGLVADGTTVSVIASNDDRTTVTVESKAKFEQPSATTSATRQNGDVEVTLPTDAEDVTLTYKNKQNTSTTVTLTKEGTNWTSKTNLPDGVSLANGKVTFDYTKVNRDTAIRTASTRGKNDVQSQANSVNHNIPEHTAPTTQNVVIAAGTTPTNEQLATGVTVATKQSVVAKNPQTAIAAGTTKVVATTLTYQDGSSETVNVTVISKPTAPTVNDLESRPNVTPGLLSTARTISGQAMPGAEKVKLTLQNGSIKEIIPEADGSWTYELGADEFLTQTSSRFNAKYTATPVSLVQVKNNVESEATNVGVVMGRAIIDTPLQAGRKITVHIPHDTTSGYIRIGGTTARGGVDIGLKKVGDTWTLSTDADKANKLELVSEADPDNPSMTKVTLQVKDTDAALYSSPFTIGSDRGNVKFRAHYYNGGNINGPVSVGRVSDLDWILSEEPTNTIPTVSWETGKEVQNGQKIPSPTVDELKDLFKGEDVEDDKGLTVGYAASNRGRLRVRVFTGRDIANNIEGTPVSAQANGRIAPGNYTLVLSTIDAARAESNLLERNVVIQSHADYYRDTVKYPTAEEKVTYNDAAITNGNFTPTAKTSFKDKIQELNGTVLPASTRYTVGTTDDKAKVAVINFPDGSTIDISHAVVAKPEVPTVTFTHDNKLSDADRTISGTALQNATKVTIQFQDGRGAQGRVDVTPVNGQWSYALPEGRYLRQTEQSSLPGSSTVPVRVTQTVFDATSDAASVYVAKDRNFTGKTITGVRGSAELEQLKSNPKDGISYTERGTEQTFPSDFDATWKTTPDVTSIGTRTYIANIFEKDKVDKVNQEVTVKVVVKPSTPSLVTAVGKKDAGSVTVNGVNSGTTVALYDMTNPANPIELGRTDVPKDGDFALKDGVAINLAPGKSLSKDMPIAVRSIYKPTVATERVESDYGTSLKVTEGLKAKDYHLIKGENPTGELKDRLQYKDDTALPPGSTVEWKEIPDYSRVGDATYKATVTIPGSGSTEVTIPVHVYPTVALASPNGYNNKQGTLSHGADAETYVVFKDGNQTVAKPAGVTVRWQGGTAPGIATASASNVGRIEVEYPADNAAGKTVQTLEVALPTYHAVAKETEVVRTIGSTFASTEASAYVKKAENGPDLPQGTEYTWQTDETGNAAYGSGTWGKVNDDWLGKKTNKVKVYYPQVDGGNPKEESLAEETEEITFVTKPATPSITTDLTGSAGTRKTIRIANATPGTTVELYNGDTKIGSVEVPKAGTTRYSDLTTVDLTMTQDIPTSTTITAKAVYKPTEATERVESDASAAKASSFITLSAKGSIQTMKGTGTLTELDNLNETTLAKLLRRSDAATDFTGATGRWKNRDATRKTAEAGTRTETLLVRLAGQTNEQEVNFTFTTLAQPSAKAVVRTNGQDITNDNLSDYVTADGNNGLSWENQPAKVEVGKALPRIQVTYPSNGVAVSDVTTQYVTPKVYALAENPTPSIDAHKGSPLSEDASDYVKPASNTEGFPNGTTHAWKNGDKPSTDHVGEVTKTVVTTYGQGDDVPAELRGKEVETPVTITVVPDKPVVTPNTDGTVDVTVPEETTKVEVTYTPEGQDAPTTVAVTKNQDGSWTAPADSGITISPDGSKITVSADKLKDGAGVTAKGITTIGNKDFTSQPSDSANAKAPRLGAPTISQNADYGIEVELDDKATHAEVDYVDAGGVARKLTFEKQANGDWEKTDHVAIGTVVTTGNKIVMQANTAKAGSTVSATQKSTLSDSSSAANHKAIGLLNNPVVTPQIDSGVQIEAPSDATSLEVTYTPAGSQAPTKVTLTKGRGGNWTVPTGFEVGTDGKLVLKAKTATAGTEVTVQAKAEDMESKPSTGKVKTAQPSAFSPESKQNGDVVIPLPADADKVVINYPESDTVTKTVELTKGADGNWTAPAGSPITVEAGKATVKQGTASSGKSITAQATAGTGTDVSAAREATITVPSHTQPTVSTITVEADSQPTADSISNAVTADRKKTAVAKAALPTVAAGTSQTVGVTVTYDDDSTEDVEVTVQAKEATPSAATTKQWQNGDVEIGLPDTADKARLTYTDKQGASQTVELSKGATGWTVTSGDTSLLDNGKLRLKPSSYTAGQAVSVSATKGSGDTTSQASSASITPTAHTVTTNTLVKPYKQNVTDNDLLDAVNAEHKRSVKLKDGTSYPTTDGFHDIELTVTYEDGSMESVQAKYKVTDASKKEIDQAAKAKKDEIDKRTDLTQEEKDKAKSDVDTAAEAAKKAIDGATTNAKVDEAKTNGKQASNNINPTGDKKVGQAQASTPAQETPVSPSTPNNSGATVTPSETRPVDKSELARLVEELETRLKALDSVDSTVVESAKALLADIKQALNDESLTEEELRDIVRRVKDVLDSLKDVREDKQNQEKDQVKDKSQTDTDLPYVAIVGSLLALLGLLLFLIARRKKESELKKLAKELTKVLQDGDLTSVDAKVLDQAREALAQAVAFLANEKESDHTEDELIEKLKAILAQLR